MDRRGPKPQNNRRILNGIFCILRTGAPWRDLPERCGPYTSAHNRFYRWRKAGIWDRLMDAIVKAHEGKVQMIAARSYACISMPPGSKKSGVRCEGRSRGGLTTKIHARVDAKGRPVRLLISPGNDHDVTFTAALLDGLEKRAVVTADKGYVADRVRAHISAQGAFATFPTAPTGGRSPGGIRLYRQRNHVERFNKLKQYRRIAAGYDELGAAFIAFIQLASVRIWLIQLSPRPNNSPAARRGAS